MKQTAGKEFARRYFYENFLASLMTPRQLRSSTFLTLLGEDFREIELLERLGVPLYRVYSVEKDLSIYERQRVRNRHEDWGVALYYGDLSEYIHSYLVSEHSISVFNLDICGSFLKHVDPVLGKLLLFARRNPSTVMATYSSAGRDNLQLKEGLKSLVILLWLAPEVIDHLVRNIYSQYRSATLGESDFRRHEVSKNMLLRHLFWFRSHMEHIMLGSYSLGVTSEELIHGALAEQDRAWRQFLSNCTFPLSYSDVCEAVLRLPRPVYGTVRMDMTFGDVEFLTYAANDGFYHNCYFATYEHDGPTVSLDTWLVESSMNLRRNRIILVDPQGNRYPSTYGRIAVNTDEAVFWTRADLSPDLRRVPVPPSTAQVPETDQSPDVPETELTPSTIEEIRKLARKGLNAQQISEKLSLKLPIPKVAAQVAVARRRSP
jgi:hypothetical protein